MLTRGIILTWDYATRKNNIGSLFRVFKALVSWLLIKRILITVSQATFEFGTEIVILERAWKKFNEFAKHVTISGRLQ